jgi:glycosyltransferase involved in cell wall biosynthesis
LNFIGPYNRTGYGIASAGYAWGLKEHITNFQVIGQPDTKAEELFSHPLINLTQKFSPADLDKDTIIFWHLNHVKQQLPSGLKGNKYLITAFEIDSFFKEDYEYIFDTFNAIFTTSEHHKYLLEKKKTDLNKSVPIFVAGHAFRLDDKHTIPFLSDEHLNQNFKTFWDNFVGYNFSNDSVFLSTVGKYESRKGHPELIEALKHKYDVPVVLVAFWNNPFITDGFPFGDLYFNGFVPQKTEKGVKLFSYGNNCILLMPPVKTRQQVHSFCIHADYYINPSKAEGWNLPLYEMACLGMPIISTINTAAYDYLHYSDKSVCNVISSEGLVDANDHQFFTKGEWANVLPSDIIKAIEYSIAYVYSADRKFLHEKLTNQTWVKLGQKIMSDISYIQSMKKD